MRLKFIKDEDTVNYKKISMFLGAISCTWKCCMKAGCSPDLCQNEPWSREPIKDYPVADVIKRYMDNPLTEAVVIGGLEPFDCFEEWFEFCCEFRKVSNDPIVFYTGYNYEEVPQIAATLAYYIPNVIIKWGRYIPNSKSRYDEVLGITLASDNQYAEVIS